MELRLWKFTFVGVGFLVLCFVDLSCWGKPIYSGAETNANVAKEEEAIPVEANVGLIIVSVIGVVCIVLVLVGCLCCQRGVFKTFESLHNGRFRQGYVNQTSNEFTMFPPGGSGGQQRGSMADIKFEPLPDIRPRGRSLPTAQRPRPATFSNVINRGLSVQDWFDDPHVNFPRYQLQYLQELGSGWFGKVVEGEANGIGISPQKTKVVVKILREDATPTDQMYFLHEVKAFRDLSHPNIMKLLGKCLESDPFLIILEHCAFKDLKTYLTQHRTESESLIQGNLLLRMACNIAAGLHHMHSHSFIHTDLAARNCLVTADLQVKIGDYGNAIEKFRENYYCAGDVAVPIRWCAPESLRCTEMTIETKEVTKEANIWSFGVVLWEIVEFGKLPYFELNDDDVLQKVIIDNSTTLSQPKTTVAHKDRVYEVMKLCWLSEPQLRPNMEKVSAMLAHLHNHKDPDISSEFEQRWNNLQPRAVPHPTRIGAGDANTNLSFESDFAAANVTAPRRSRDWDTSSSMSPVYSLSLEGDFPGNNGSTISPSLQNLRGSMDDLNAASSSSVGGGRSLAEQTSVSEGDLNEGAMTHESTPDLKTRSASEDLLQQRRSEEHSPRKVQREFDAWLQQQQSQGAEASQMALQISEAIGDLDQALASEKSSESSSHQASPERDATLTCDEQNYEDDMDVDEEEAERRWTEMVDGTTREAAQVTELVREKSQSVQDFLKLTVIDSDNSDSDLNTPRHPPSSSSPAPEDEGVLHKIPTSKIAAFATEVAGASVTAAVREASSPIPRSGNTPSPLLVAATGAATLITAQASLTGADMLNSGDEVSPVNPSNDAMTEQSPVLSFLSSATLANDQPPSINFPVVTEASLTSSQVVMQPLGEKPPSVEREPIPPTIDSSALNDFRLVLNDVAKDLQPEEVACSNANNDDNFAAAKSSSNASVIHEHELDSSSPRELTDASCSYDVHSHLGRLASTPVRLVEQPDLSAYFANPGSDDLVNESSIDDLWSAEGTTTSRKNVWVEDIALIIEPSSAHNSDVGHHIEPLNDCALKPDLGFTHNTVDNPPEDTAFTTNKSQANKNDCSDDVCKDSLSRGDCNSNMFFITATDEVLTDIPAPDLCNFDEETGETSRMQSPNQVDGISLRMLTAAESSFKPITDYASPRGFDSEASTTTMYLTCDDSTQSSCYQTDSDAGATTLDESCSSNEGIIDSMKEVVWAKHSATFDDGDTTKQANTISSESEYTDGSKLLVLSSSAEDDDANLCNVSSDPCVTEAFRNKLADNPSDVTNNSNPFNVNCNFGESSCQDAFASSSGHKDVIKRLQPTFDDLMGECDSQQSTSNISINEGSNGMLQEDKPKPETMSLSSDNAFDETSTAEELLHEITTLNSDACISLPSDNLLDGVSVISLDIPAEISNPVMSEGTAKDVFETNVFVDSTSDSVASLHACNLEDSFEAFSSELLNSDTSLLAQNCESISGDDKVILTTTFDADKIRDYEQFTFQDDSKTIELAGDQNSLDLKLVNEAGVCDAVSSHKETESLEVLGIAAADGVSGGISPDQAAGNTTILAGANKEAIVNEDLVSVIADCYAEDATADTSSEEEEAQEAARDSLSDGTFERATTPLVVNAFTLDPVVPLELSGNEPEVDNSHKSIISTMKPLETTPVLDNAHSLPGSLKVEDDKVFKSPSSSGLDVMSGDAETVEFEFFVSSDGNGNSNLESVPCSHILSDKHLVEDTTSGGSDPKQNTFVKFDSDITPDNCSDYGTHLEAASDAKYQPQVDENHETRYDDEKRSEGSDSSGLSTLYEIEDIEEALADVDTSEDDSRQSGDVEDIDEVSESGTLDVQPTLAPFNEDELSDAEEQAIDNLPDWNGNNPLISNWHHNGLHNFVPLHSTIEEVSEEEETISGLADAFQHAFSRIVRRLSEVEMEMVSDENEGSVVGVTPPPVKEIALSAETLKAVKGGSNGNTLIHDAMNEVMVSCVADMLDNDDGKSFNLKKHELTLDTPSSTINTKSREDIVLNNNCKNSVFNHDENSISSYDVTNANRNILEPNSNTVNGLLDEKVDNIIVESNNYDDVDSSNHEAKSENLPEALNSVTIEDLDIPRNGIDKVTYCPASRDSEDDVLIVDTETNEVTLLESNRPRPHLAFVRQSLAESLPFETKNTSDGEESESEVSSSAGEDAGLSQSKLVGNRFVVVPCAQTGVVIHEDLEDSSSVSLEAIPGGKFVTDYLASSTSSDSDSFPNNIKLDLNYSPCAVGHKVKAEMECITPLADKPLEIPTVEPVEPQIAERQIVSDGKTDNEALVSESSHINDDCFETIVADNIKESYNPPSPINELESAQLSDTSIGTVDRDQTEQALGDVLQRAADTQVMTETETDIETDPSSLEGILKFASMCTVDHETEIISAVTSKDCEQVPSPALETAKAPEGIVLDVMESDPEDELVALVPVCADASEVSPSLQVEDNKREVTTPDVCYTPDWESDTETSSSQSSSSTSGEFEVNKSTKPSDTSEDLTYAPLTNILELPSIDHEDEHSDDELDAETRAALETFQPSEWNKHATPSRGLLRSPEKKSEGKKCVSFKMQKRQVIYEYPKEDKSWDDEHASSRSSWSDQVYDPQMDFTNSIDWELGDDEIPEDIVEVEDFDDGSRGYDSAPVFRLHDDALYRLSNINYEDACDGGRNGMQNDGDGGEGEVVMYDPESGGLTFQQLLEHYGNNPALFGSPPDGEELWPQGALQDPNFFVDCSTENDDPFKMDAQQFYNAHYLPQYFLEASHNYFSTGGEGGEPDPRASQEDEAYLGAPESDYMRHRFGPAAAGFHYYDPVMGVNMFVGNGENDDIDFADALDRMIQREQNSSSQNDVQHDGNNGDDSDSDDIPSFEVKPKKSSVAVCDTVGPQGTTMTMLKTPNELKLRNETGERSINTDVNASSININGVANSPGHDRDLSSDDQIASCDGKNDNLSPHGTDSGLGTPSIEEISSSPAALTSTASSSSVSLDASRTYPAVGEIASHELFI